MKQSKYLVLTVIFLCTALALTGCKPKDDTPAGPVLDQEALSYRSGDSGCKPKDDTPAGPVLDQEALSYRSGDSFIMANSLEHAVLPGTTIDPQKIYHNLTYIPEMFYGNYQIENYDDVIAGNASFNKDRHWMNDLHGNSISTVPVAITAGPMDLYTSVEDIPESILFRGDYDLMRLTFLDTLGKETHFDCAYFVNGNTITFRPVRSCVLVVKAGDYAIFFSDYTFSYQFSFRGTSLTLTDGTDSVTLISQTTDLKDLPSFEVSHYLTPESEAFHDLTRLDFHWNQVSGKFSTACNAYEDDSQVYGYLDEDISLTLSDSGICTITFWGADGSSKTHEFVYFYGGKNSGIVLADAQQTYCYTDTQIIRKKRLIYSIDPLTLNAGEDEQAEKNLEKVTEEQVTLILEKKKNLAADLIDAFNNVGLDVTVNETTGEIILDSSVIFGGNQSAVTSEGKELLNRFVEALSSVIFSDAYSNFISQIRVEGHTAPTAGDSYEHDLPLSLSRAENVLAYCISEETGLSPKQAEQLAALMEPVGLSNGTPIYTPDGQVDMNASRRVCFRFIVNLDGQ